MPTVYCIWGLTTVSTTEEHNDHSGGGIEPQGHKGTKERMPAALKESEL